MSITTILQTFRRPTYLKEQVDAIRNQTIKSEKIIIVANEGGVPFDFSEYKDCEIIYSSVNRRYHLRFAIGLLEKSDYLFFYDDDTTPGIEATDNFIETIDKYDCIAVGNGREILSNYTQSCPAGWGNPNNEAKEVDFGGHLWACKREHLNYLWRETPINFGNGEDISFSALAKIYGGIRTFVPPHPLDNREKWSSLKGMEYGSDKVASYITNPIHYPERIELIKYYISKGWKTAYFNHENS